MVFHMKTTLNINDKVMRKLKAEAARRGTTMSELVEAGLRRILEDSADEGEGRPGITRLPSWASGGARVDVANREQLHEMMEGD